jgi:hypothetical protein
VLRKAGVRFPTLINVFLFPTAFRQVLSPTHPPIQWVRRPVSVNYSLPSRAEVKNGGAIPPLLYGAQLEAKGQLTF